LVFTDAREGSEYAEAVAIRPDGRILVAGHATPSLHHEDIELVQYLTDGTLDASFGEGGVTITESVGPGPDEVAAVAVQLDGAIVAVGTAYTGSGFGFALARYRPDGTLDPSFGEGGTTTT